MIATAYGSGIYRASEAHVEFRPRIYTDNARYGVIHCHGYASPLGALTASYLTTYRDIPAGLTRVGAPSVSADLGGGTTWGNATSSSAMDDAFTYLQAAGGGKDGKCALVCGSMGAVVGMNWARQHLSSVVAIALLIPVVDVEDVRANNRGSYQASIETAYTDNATWQTARPTRNPTQYAASLAGIPIAAWYSTDDTIATSAAMTAFAAAHGNTVLHSMGAIGHLSTATGDEVASFLKAYL